MAINFESQEELDTLADEHEGLCTVSTRLLIDTHDVGRLCTNVLSNISSERGGYGSGHSPNRVLSFQYSKVLVCLPGGDVGRLTEALSDPGDGRAGRLTTIDSDAQAMIEPIRELVCDWIIIAGLGCFLCGALFRCLIG